MTAVLKLSIPLIINNAGAPSSMQEAVASAIVKNQRKFHPLFERLIIMGDARITVMDDSLTVVPSDIELDSTSGVASGVFQSDFYAGCKDINSVDEHEVDLQFEIRNGELIFEIELPPAWIPEYD